MKKILLSILKFAILFVPAYVVINLFQPEIRAQMLEGNILANILTVAGKGLVIGTILMVGVALIDKFKKKDENEELK